MLHGRNVSILAISNLALTVRNKPKTLNIRLPYIPCPLLAAHSSKLHLTSWAHTHVTKKNNKYLLPSICYFSTFPEAIPPSSVNEVSITNAMIEILSRCGLPEEILTDQGPVFMGKLMAQLCKLLDIKPICTYFPLPCTD